MINHLKKTVVCAVVFSFCWMMHLQGVELAPYQPLTKPLHAVFGDNVITAESVINFECGDEKSNFSSLSWLDNQHLIYSHNDQIEILQIDLNKRVILATGSCPKNSPDGLWIAYVVKNNDKNQIWLMKKDGTDKRQLTHFDNGIGDDYEYEYGFAWSADSKQLALYMNPTTPPPISHETNLSNSKIFVIEAQNGNAKQVYADCSTIKDLSWFPDNKALLMTKLLIDFVHHSGKHETFVQSVSLIDGHVRILTKIDGLQQWLFSKISPDGLNIAILFDAEIPDYSYMRSLSLISNLAGESISLHQLTHEIKLNHAKWSTDSENLFLVRNYGAYNQIYTLNSQSKKLKQITNIPLKIEEYSISPDDSKVVWTGINAHGASFLSMATSSGEDVQDLIVDNEHLNNIALGEVREIEWDTIDYPSKIRGLLCLPLNYKKGMRYPLVVDIHGGDSGCSIQLGGGILTSSPLEWQLWAAKGYAVFIPEFRSSAAFGSLAITRDLYERHEIINCDLTDILCGIDELARQGIIDTNRMAVIGHSAGGRRANWLTVSKHLFRVVVSKEGWTDERLQAMRFPATWPIFGGSPLEVPENYLKNSAIHHVKGASTPTLFLMGNPNNGGLDIDYSVQELYKAIKELGIDTEYVEYNEGHCFMAPNNRRHALNKAMEWIDNYTSITP